MITFEDAMQKAHHYLGDADIPVVITSLGRFSEGWFFAFSPRVSRNRRNLRITCWKRSFYS
jgi:hypothetical protein